MSLNIFPLHILKTSEKSQVMIELKSGDTYNGTLEEIDRFMNVKLSEVTYSSKNSQTFMSMKEAYLKGFFIKYFQLHEQAVDKALDEMEIYLENKETQKQKNKDKKKEEKEKTVDQNKKKLPVIRQEREIKSMDNRKGGGNRGGRGGSGDRGDRGDRRNDKSRGGFRGRRGGRQ